MSERKRVDVHMQAGGYELLSKEADRNGISMGEELMRAWCEKMAVDIDLMKLPRQKTGRKTGQAAKARKKTKAERI